MLKRIVSGTMLTLLLASVFILAFAVRQASPKYPEAPAMDWTRTYGGHGNDEGYSIIQTSDGGYAIAGSTDSYGAGKLDFFLIKTDADGYMQWNKTYGGANDESSWSMIQTRDGGYAIVGYTDSFGAGGWDFWLVKTDANGSMQWNKTYGGSLRDRAYSVVETEDGFAVVGFTQSYEVSGFQSIWLVKTDTNGNMQWSEAYGWSDYDGGLSLIRTSDGGYAIAGDSFFPSTTRWDFRLVKTSANGSMQWTKTYGGTNDENALSLIQTEDSGYLMVGHTGLLGSKDYDFWLVKTDTSGLMNYSKTYGGLGDDIAYSVIRTRDHGYAIAGQTNSFGAGQSDFWLIKTDASANVQWNQTYGGPNDDFAYSLVNTIDGGYAIGGSTNSGNADFMLVKTVGGAYVFDVTWGLGMGSTNVTILCNETVTSFSFNKTDRENERLSFAILAEYPGICNVTIPRNRLDGPFNVTIDGMETPLFSMAQNATHSTLGFSYTSGTHSVKITATERGYIIGDINGDGKVDMRDIGTVAKNFGHKEEDYP